ncbi:TRAP transporter substrate-binding protein (plasmid) [Tistrella bauzanensis]|uniref:TRAP transporter substrate-binding protein n=1 Tax=Tistrella arctica TaxID=3133430 RepID=A0ABU9YL04_9PROT
MQILRSAFALCILGAVAMQPVAAVARETAELRFGYWLSGKGHEWVNVFAPWAERVEAASGGTLKIVPFTGGTLGRDPAAQLKMVEDGVADITYPVPAYTPDRFPDNTVAEIPGLYASSRAASSTMWGLYEAGLLTGFDGLKVLGLFASPPFSISATRPVASLADVQGQKLRTAGRYGIRVIEAMGGTAVAMSVSESAEALTRGVIDGVASHPSLDEQTGVAEIARNHFLARLGTGHVMLVMRQSVFDALPEAAQAAIDAESGRALSEAWGGAADDKAEALLAAWSAAGSGHVVTMPSDKDVAALDQIFGRIQAEWAAEGAGRDRILQAVRNRQAGRDDNDEAGK